MKTHDPDPAPPLFPRTITGGVWIDAHARAVVARSASTRAQVGWSFEDDFRREVVLEGRGGERREHARGVRARACAHSPRARSRPARALADVRR